ncbi:MAG: Rieske 2Fe-2S domain-containing protein [Bacteroidota bacterium]
MTIINFIIDLLRRLIPSFNNNLAHIVTYTRELPINLDRMYENALDWEHLPFLHSSTFSFIEKIDAGDWGWRAKAALHPKSFMTTMVIELRLDKTKNRWITKTHSGLGKGTEIWTHAIPLGDNKIKVIVDFYVPKFPRFLKSMYAQQYTDLYAQLYDEDLWMMADRQAQLDNLTASKLSTTQTSMVLGKLEDIRAKLPYTFKFNNQSFRLVNLNGQMFAHSMTCPHMLGPLNDADIQNGILVCPWHGYEFDLKTRECVSGQKCKMAPAPKVKIDKKKNEILVLTLHN